MAASTSARSAFRPEVQGLRAVAVVAVVLYHAGDLLPGGFVGVDVFFVISGYVITRSLHREHALAGRIDLRDFYRRRVRRLAPALTVAIAAVTLLTPVLGPLGATRQAGEAGLAATLFGANLWFAQGAGYFDLAAELNPLLHTWSLSLEEQFYLVLPALLAGLYALGRRRRDVPGTLALGLLVASAASLAIGLALSYGPALPTVNEETTRRLAFFLMPARAWQFGAGALLAVAGLPRRSHVRRAAGPVGVALLVAVFVLVDDGMRYPGVVALLPTLATVLVLLDTDGWVARTLSRPAPVRMGDASYSWYLWHWPAIVFAGGLGVDAPLVLAAVGLGTLPLATLTYDQVEQRFRRGGRRGGWVPILATSVLVGLAGVAVTRVAVAELRDGSAAAAALVTQIDQQCDRQPVSSDLSACVIGDGARRVVLLGDSNAGQVSDAVVAAASPDDQVVLLTRSACPMLGTLRIDDGTPDTTCQATGTSVRAWLSQEPPDVVIIAGSWDLRLGTASRGVRYGDLDGPAAYEAALGDLVEVLEAGGSQVVILATVPKFRVDDEGFSAAAGCSWLGARLAADACTFTIPRADALARRATALDIEQSVAAATSATVLDPFPVLCPADPCRDQRDGTWLYRDPRHISGAAAQLLVPLFEDALGTGP